MKQFRRLLAGLLCTVVFCTLAPAAFAAKVIINFDPNGGSCSTAAEMTNADGQLTGLPTPTLKGYNFDGWYIPGTDEVTGAEISVRVAAWDTVFHQNTTVYAHWSANGDTAEVKSEVSPADPRSQILTFGLAAGSVLAVLAASMML